VNQFFGGLRRGVTDLRLNKICAYVVLDHVGHERIQCASRTGDEQEHVGTAVTLPNSPLYGFDLAEDSPDALN
jgi:hypothetical protein